MEDAFGFLHWHPVVFWESTLTEFLSARDGLNRANGVEEKPQGPSDDDLDALVRQYG
ncbi:phage tail assembly chaperone [Mesorhizobium sp. CGMCC 1.15528]|uniref:Phage tail assembly chaperone n=1 Tax=Mesorhizobium zhangyense TaxID=1776730 RepID=A0A7C9VI18_9HYPH|nr:phage tail assembly chaperone [Mesorhizobium zhangyense]